MNRRRLRRRTACRWLLAFAVAAGPGPLGAALRLTLDDRPVGAQAGTVVIVAGGGALRLETDGSGPALFRAGTRDWLLLDVAEGVFDVLDGEAADRLTGGAERTLGQLDEALADLPEDQRALARELFRDGMPDLLADESTRPPDAPLEVRRRRERAIYQGVECVRFEVRRYGAVIRELWVAPWDALPDGEGARDVFLAAASFLDDLDRRGRRATGIWDVEDVVPGAAYFVDGLRLVDGLPLAIEIFADGTPVRRLVARALSAEDGPVPADPPAGARRRGAVERP